VIDRCKGRSFSLKKLLLAVLFLFIIKEEKVKIKIKNIKKRK
jgi:hypothetical protein